MSDSVKISVVIPVFNAQRYLRQCLDSVLSQSVHALEVICVDDGSQDQSLEILREYEQRDARVHVITQNNKFAGAARNNGLRIAGGEYVAFLDSDDFYLPGALEALYSLAKTHRLDWVKGRFRYLDMSGGRRYTTPYSINSSVGRLRRRQVLSFHRLPQRLLQVADVPWNGLYRRSFLERNGILFNHLRCVNDHSFFIHCLLKAQRIMITDRITTCYRVNQADSLIGRKAQLFLCQLESYSIVRDLCQNEAPPLRQLVLRQELNGIFGWYERLVPLSDDPAALKEALHAFLQRFSEQDVGPEFVRQFSFRELYHSLRGLPVPSGRRPLLPRLIDCWREHGFYYTLFQIKRRLERKIKHDRSNQEFP